jgi:hypothetical protein
MDINKWLPNFNLFFFTLDVKLEGGVPEINKVLNETISEKDFDKELKIPLRLILDPLFKSTYKRGKTE